MSQLARFAAGLVTTLVIFGWSAPASANQLYAGLVMDARTNDVLYEDQADAQRLPASPLTKMMTLYKVFEAIERGD